MVLKWGVCDLSLLRISLGWRWWVVDLLDLVELEGELVGRQIWIFYPHYYRKLSVQQVFLVDYLHFTNRITDPVPLTSVTVVKGYETPFLTICVVHPTRPSLSLTPPPPNPSEDLVLNLHPHLSPSLLRKPFVSFHPLLFLPSNLDGNSDSENVWCSWTP